MKRFAVMLACCALMACGAQPASQRVAPNTNAHEFTPHDLPAFFDCLRENSQTLVAAHRGGPSPGYAENAIATFEHTVSQIPALLEIDVARTRDGALVLMHDDDVDRTTTGRGAVNDLTLAEFQALNLQDDDGRTLDAHPPSLREALDWAAGKAILELDVKRSVAFEDVAAAAREAGAENRVIVITYSVAAARRMARIAPELMIATTIENQTDLRDLQNARVDLTRIIAWTGIEEPNAALNVALAQAGVEAAFGTVGGARSWDNRFTQNGEDQYAAFAETGLQLIASDRPLDAVRDLDAHDGVDGYGALQCLE
jgi:glycerophosphoryl diester phosphodiesterase